MGLEEEVSTGVEKRTFSDEIDLAARDIMRTYAEDMIYVLDTLVEADSPEEYMKRIGEGVLLLLVGYKRKAAVDSPPKQEPYSGAVGRG